MYGQIRHEYVSGWMFVGHHSYSVTLVTSGYKCGVLGVRVHIYTQLTYIHLTSNALVS